MTDTLGNEIEPYKWYQVIVRDTNPYDFARHIMVIDKKSKKGKYYVLEIWTNSNHEGWQPSISTLPEVFFNNEMFKSSSEKMLSEYKRLQPLFMKKVFDKWAR